MTKWWWGSSTARSASPTRCSGSRSGWPSSNAKLVGAKAIVKGLRAISDFEYELEMNQLNRRQDPEIESVYLMASPQYSFLSSSGVKELATFGGRIDDLVPDGVAVRLQEELRR
jgi:pantetheine-phosphate adenylyltransferase